MPAVYVTQYASFGGRKKGGDDDTTSHLPQIPGQIVSFKEIDTDTNNQVVFEDATAFVKVRVKEGDVYYNLDDDDTGDGATVVADNRDIITENEIFFQGIVLNKTGAKIYNKINFIERVVA